ncbi:antitoxin [Pseudanabaena sp. UWO310]|uniref:antitoxin n=1 Tax=Pseudanabaena sp. UWO310 TaxID=2480795 RepID=UPI00115894F7|nr:AbrB/MazE/SpoVT family DNA-binding domain-containing protein [Pseudanabaena sp. UWO310]TYQ25652.1 AbrB/MazE/SpoVT family DNA-binding domain-containing protein [Pseudanabaena sp. UWO310]
MVTQYQVRLFHNGRNQTLNIPHALEMPSNDVVIRRDGERLIIEPFKKRSLLELLATLEDIDEDFPNVDEGLVPLDNIQF